MAYYIPHQINNIPPHTSSAILSSSSLWLCYFLLFNFLVSLIAPITIYPSSFFCPPKFCSMRRYCFRTLSVLGPLFLPSFVLSGVLDLAVFCWRRVSHNQQKFNLIISLEKVLKRCKLARVLACDSAMLLNFFHRVKFLLLTLPNYLFFHLMK